MPNFVYVIMYYFKRFLDIVDLLLKMSDGIFVFLMYWLYIAVALNFLDGQYASVKERHGFSVEKEDGSRVGILFFLRNGCSSI